MTTVERPAPSLGRALTYPAVVGLLLGALTSVGQTHLPDALRSAANCATTWTLAAAALAWPARRWWVAVVVAMGAFVLLLAGYEIASELRLGFGMATATWAFWVLCAVVVGPVLGLLVHRARHDRPLGAALLAAALGGVAIGEGVYGLTVVSSSTSPVWWTISIVVGVVLVAFASRGRRLVPDVVVGVLGAALVAAVYVGAYAGAGGLL